MLKRGSEAKVHKKDAILMSKIDLKSKSNNATTVISALAGELSIHRGIIF